MERTLATRTLPIIIEDEGHCSEKCLQLNHHIPRCCLFSVDISVEEDGRLHRPPACRDGEQMFHQQEHIKKLARAADEMATLVQEAAEHADGVATALQMIKGP